jgi:hypothetical protein
MGTPDLTHPVGGRPQEVGDLGTGQEPKFEIGLFCSVLHHCNEIPESADVMKKGV